ncbi:hypothetical protein Cfor_06645 [Coptotermes formosanus]|uniref:Uncharacterized protein n=1 Tax=Coptotermes formosanus TaxID=36987 RepID=A0A6L2QBV3_COPFO|nr:hypothetical protein Cfor_06645 [Coptotermes formosanus]
MVGTWWYRNELPRKIDILHFNPAQHKHVRYSLGLISVTIVCHGTEKMRNENGRMLKKGQEHVNTGVTIQGQNNSSALFPTIPEDVSAERDSVTLDLEPIFVKPRALVPGATLSPVFLSEGHRTFWNPISYLGGPRLLSPNMTRASKESVLSVD